MLKHSFANWIHRLIRITGRDIQSVGIDGAYLLYPLQRCGIRRDQTLERAFYWEFLAQVMSSLSNPFVLDIGANKGQFASGLRAVGYPGPIASFEPIPALAKSLRMRSNLDPNWTVHELALGFNGESCILNVNESTELSSIRKASQFGARLFGSEIKTVSELSLPLERLDMVIPRELSHLADANVFLKIDTQGADLDVFRGLGRFERHVAYVQVEMTFQPLYEDVPDFRESLEFFNANGFKPIGFFPACVDPASQSLVEVDCILKRAGCVVT
jgi:FkbM family methyltransferase